MSLWNRYGIGSRWALPLAVGGVLVLTTPTWASEREGTVIYFALEELQLDLRQIEQYNKLQPLVPHMDWQTLKTDQHFSDNGQTEHCMRWGNGQRIDGHRLPGMSPL